MAYGSKRVFAYESDLNDQLWGLRLSELIYEKNPQLGTNSTIKPTAGTVFSSLPSTIKPRHAVFRNTASMASRKYVILSLNAEIWKGNTTTIGVPAQDPNDPDFDLQIIEFTAVSFVGERTSGLLVAGVDTGMTQGDQD